MSVVPGAKSEPLIRVSDEEWGAAEAFFNENPTVVKFRRTHPSDSGDERQHSFIKVGNEIFLMANKAAAGHSLGEGAFGRVKMVQTRSGENFAVKIEGFRPNRENKAEEDIMKLLNVWKGKNIRPLGEEKVYKTRKITSKMYTVMRLVSGVELEKKIYEKKGSSKKVLSYSERLRIALRSCEAVKVLHDKRIIHADIKPGNFMINREGEEIVVESIDFGFSMQLPDDVDNITGQGKGTPGYMAPEIAEIGSDGKPIISKGHRSIYSFKSDIFSLGVMLKSDLGLLTEEVRFLNPKIFNLVEGMTDVFSPNNRPDLGLVIGNLKKAYEKCDKEQLKQQEVVEPPKVVELTLGSLLDAIKSGNFEMVTELIADAKASDLDVGERQRSTPLLCAIQKGNAEIVKALIDKGANVNLEYQYKTPLTFAIIKNDIDLMKILFEKGATFKPDEHLTAALSSEKKVEIVNELLNKLHKEKTELSLNNKKDIVNDAVLKGNVDVVKMLLLHFKDVSGCSFVDIAKTPKMKVLLRSSMKLHLNDSASKHEKKLQELSNVVFWVVHEKGVSLENLNEPLRKIWELEMNLPKNDKDYKLSLKAVKELEEDFKAFYNEQRLVGMKAKNPGKKDYKKMSKDIANDYDIQKKAFLKERIPEKKSRIFGFFRKKPANIKNVPPSLSASTEQKPYRPD